MIIIMVIYNNIKIPCSQDTTPLIFIFRELFTRAFIFLFSAEQIMNYFYNLPIRFSAIKFLLKKVI